MGYWIVTGAGRGLGYALALGLLQRNHRVFGIGRGEAPKFSVRSGYFQWIQADLADWTNLEPALQEIFKAIPRTSWTGQKDELVLVNNAATLGPIKPALNVAPEEFRDTLAVDLLAPVVLSSAFSRLSRALGFSRSILNLSSGAASRTIQGWAGYSAAKAGLDRFAQVMAADEDHLGTGLQVFSVSPGVLDTGMQALIRQAEAADFSARDDFAAYQAEGKLVKPEAAAEVLLRAFEQGRLRHGQVQHLRQLS